MDLIYRRTLENNAIDSGYVTNFKADFDITTDAENATNDFVLTCILPKDRADLLWIENEVSCIIFVPDTEYGGEITGSVIDIQDNTIAYTGRTWRGTMQEHIIEPPAGEDYRTVSGNLKTIIDSLPKSDWITVNNTSYTSSSYQFHRYVTTFHGLNGLYNNVNPLLRDSYSFSETSLKASLSLDMARDLTDLIEVSQDYNNNIQLKITRDYRTPHRLICLGQGELRDREVINYYADDNWNISTTPIAGAYPVETYDFSSSTDLAADGLKYYKELIGNHKQIDVVIQDLDVKLGDIIAAKDFLTGEYVTAEISKIVWRVENFGHYQFESFEYGTKLRT